ncbi:MAG: hypothetical protein AB7K24_16725 [Gemmataceae bacterium]
MEDITQLLAYAGRIALVPLIGYGVLRLGQRWPWGTLTLLFALIALGTGALTYVARDGFSIEPTSRRMEFGSELGSWCFVVGAVLVTLGCPALLLVPIARARNGERTGPVGIQWVVVLMGYFVACAIFGMVLYSWLTAIVK